MAVASSSACRLRFCLPFLAQASFALYTRVQWLIWLLSFGRSRGHVAFNMSSLALIPHPSFHVGSFQFDLLVFVISWNGTPVYPRPETWESFLVPPFLTFTYQPVPSSYCPLCLHHQHSGLSEHSVLSSSACKLQFKKSESSHWSPLPKTLLWPCVTLEYKMHTPHKRVGGWLLPSCLVSYLLPPPLLNIINTGSSQLLSCTKLFILLWFLPWPRQDWLTPPPVYVS